MTEFYRGHEPHLGHPDSLEAIVGQQVLNDFYTSFEMTQGNPDLHSWCIELMGAWYQDHWSAAERDTLLAILPTLDAAVPHLRLPGNHSLPAHLKGGGNIREIVRDEFKDKWVEFKDGIDEGATLSANYKKERLELITQSMILTDADRVIEGRPFRRPGEDPHQSFFRDYVLLGQSTGSPPLDAIMADIREAHQRGLYRVEAEDLAHAWENRHPNGPPFVPPPASQGSLFDQQNNAVPAPGTGPIVSVGTLKAAVAAACEPLPIDILTTAGESLRQTATVVGATPTNPDSRLGLDIQQANTRLQSAVGHILLAREHLQRYLQSI